MSAKYLFLLVLIVTACKENPYSEKNSSISISGQKFEKQEALELNNLGVKKAKEGDHYSAKDKFFKALELEPNNPTILSNIGLYYQNQEMNKKAIEYHQKALLVSDSTYLISGVNLGHVYYQVGQYSKAIDILDFVIKEGKEKRLLITAHINRGFNYVRNGECIKAKSDLNYAKINKPEDDKMIFQINRLEQKINQMCTTAAYSP